MVKKFNLFMSGIGLLSSIIGLLFAINESIVSAIIIFLIFAVGNFYFFVKTFAGKEKGGEVC